jgi:hypothetical protein
MTGRSHERTPLGVPSMELSRKEVVEHSIEQSGRRPGIEQRKKKKHYSKAYGKN